MFNHESAYMPIQFLLVFFNNTGIGNFPGCFVPELKQQFFIISGPSGVGLPPQYSLFGKVTAGTEVIDAISAVPTDVQDAPTTAVVINSVVITEGS